MPGERATPNLAWRVGLVATFVVLAALVMLAGVATFMQPALDEPPSSIKTPNPSKAPWYFLGPQEWLVYYDPWLAGVLPPLLIIAAQILGPCAVALAIVMYYRRRRANAIAPAADGREPGGSP